MHRITSLPIGEVAEWTKAADCKSAGASLRRFESCPPHSNGAFFTMGSLISRSLSYLCIRMFCNSKAVLAGVAQLARASAFQAEGRGFESRLPLIKSFAHVAQSVEHILGKDEVSGSSPLVGSIFMYKVDNYLFDNSQYATIQEAS